MTLLSVSRAPQPERMSGYNVTFDSLFTGSLCGQWPYLSVWTTLLAMRDKNGHLDVTPQYICSVTGIPMDVLLDCITKFTSPDPASRTISEDGRRMRLIDSNRPWGWVIINHQVYKERARLMSKNQREVETGSNASRMGDRRGPPGTAGDRLSESEAKTEADKRGADAPPPDPRKTSEPKKRASKRCPTDFEVTSELREWARSNYPGVNLDRETAKFRDHEYRVAKVDWPAAWRTWISKAEEFKPSKPSQVVPQRSREFPSS